MTNIEFTFLLPCLNEAETLHKVIAKIQSSIKKLELSAEILIADNGSSDGSQEIGSSSGARVIDVPIRGYGSALKAGILNARGKFIVMGDSDDSYAFDKLEDFIFALRQGNDLVMGNRFRGGIEKGAMPFLHQYLGNPVLSWIGRRLFKSPIGDFHCGLRAFNREKILGISLQSNGMEFASEMIVKSTLANLKITEVPTTLSVDGRTRKPHLNTWRDGWRHLSFLLASSPRWLFLFPSLVFLFFGILGMATTSMGSIEIANVFLDSNFFLMSVGITLTGLQLFLSAILARVFSTRYGFLPNNQRITFFQKIFTLERGIVLSLSLISIAITLLLFLLSKWTGDGFDQISNSQSLRLSGLFIVTLCGGIQILFSSFFAALIQA